MDKRSLKQYIKDAGYSYRSLAVEIGTTPDALVAWGNGSRVPRFDNAIVLAAKLGISLKQLAQSIGQDVSEIPDDCNLDIDSN